MRNKWIEIKFTCPNCKNVIRLNPPKKKWNKSTSLEYFCECGNVIEKKILHKLKLPTKEQSRGLLNWVSQK